MLLMDVTLRATFHRHRGAVVDTENHAIGGVQGDRPDPHVSDPGLIASHRRDRCRSGVEVLAVGWTERMTPISIDACTRLNGSAPKDGIRHFEPATSASIGQALGHATLGADANRVTTSRHTRRST